MYGKMIIKSKLKVLTGLHIGGSNVFSPIGAVDSPVVRDPLTNKPIVPGSSLKGKMRTLLARAMKNDKKDFKSGMPEITDDLPEIKRLFGSHSPQIIKSRLQFADAFVCNEDEMFNIGLTEIKFENTISRNTATANPRQIERVISGVKFDVKITYEYANESASVEKTKAELTEDMNNIAKAMKLLQMDYLGGHGTRGSGRVSFEEIELQPFFCDKELEQLLPDLIPIFKGVESYELLDMGNLINDQSTEA